MRLSCLLSGRPERNSDGAAHALAFVPDVELPGEFAGDGLAQQARAKARDWLRRERGSAQLAPIDGQDGFRAAIVPAAQAAGAWMRSSTASS